MRMRLWPARGELFPATVQAREMAAIANGPAVRFEIADSLLDEMKNFHEVA
jgi:hypothetical protein